MIIQHQIPYLKELIQLEFTSQTSNNPSITKHIRMNSKIIQIFIQIWFFILEQSFKLQQQSSDSCISEIKCGYIYIFKLSHNISKTKECVCFIFNDQIQWSKQITHSLHIFNGWIKFTINIQDSSQNIRMNWSSITLLFSSFILICEEIL
ncbi:unnamed protein product [Paramecium sonneborni]|uniref:Uncharacterized protein n=1 Tax=Paramecium sonneborni TaxID=65129 RepID=A0A8S1Q2X7_9CILI|nr:unnamed protein product [Paramecium sonneborni]